MPFYIKVLKKHKAEQILREEGPKSHASKANTVTAGGVLIILAFLIAVFVGWVFIRLVPHEHTPGLGVDRITSMPVVIAALMCGFIGFLDDAAKIREKSNKGIRARTRLMAEAVIGVLLGLALLASPHMDPDPSLGLHLCLGTYEFLRQYSFLLVFLSAFLMAATTNAVNLNDGMDGLCAGTSFLAFATLSFLLYSSGQYVLAMVAATACGAIAGFFPYNKHPAKIFMGDTGSLFIGGLMAALVAASGMVIYFIPLSMIYILEAVSWCRSSTSR
jgi:phospho-N-acetylmuramoyl-pentapeptide-transferase